jgi:predicted RNA-binding Zn ribbon-like protein
VSDDGNDELRLVGGHPALDLVNTVAPRLRDGTGGREYLRDPAELLAWSRRVGIVGAAEEAAVGDAWRAAPPTAEQALRAAIEIREATYVVLVVQSAGVSNRQDALDSELALERLTLRWAAAAARSALLPAASEDEVVSLIVGTSPTLMIPDRLASSAVELLRTINIEQLRTCPVAEGGCGWLFLDRSRNGSRRWCSMADCGTQAKIRRLTERRRGSLPL